MPNTLLLQLIFYKVLKETSIFETLIMAWWSFNPKMINQVNHRTQWILKLTPHIWKYDSRVNDNKSILRCHPSLTLTIIFRSNIQHPSINQHNSSTFYSQQLKQPSDWKQLIRRTIKATIHNNLVFTSILQSQFWNGKQNERNE